MADVTEEEGEINRNHITVFCCDYISLSLSVLSDTREFELGMHSECI